MSNYNTLKTIINANIKQNGNQEITGQILNSVLNQMVTTLGAEYQFAGVATTATKPGTPDAKVFYIANGKGTYANFGNIEVTEDEVVVLYYDTEWHKVATGIASQEKLTELDSQIEAEATARTDADKALQTQINGKQEALTLTVKDNGNIVIANIQGQSKEFMPATPSGDPMHYAYVTAGAEYNDTGEDIVKTAPWADLADDDADKTVVHKNGYWYLNGLGDITNEQMRNIYIKTYYCNISSSNATYPDFSLNALLRVDTKCRTNFCFNKSIGENIAPKYYSISRTFQFSICEVAVISNTTLALIAGPYNLYSFGSSKIKHIEGILAFDPSYRDYDTGMFGSLLETVRIYRISSSLKMHMCSKLTSKSILYMIQNEAATSAITITLHADAYARAMANADIVAALEAHPNVSLASA